VKRVVGSGYKEVYATLGMPLGCIMVYMPPWVCLSGMYNCVYATLGMPLGCVQ